MNNNYTNALKIFFESCDQVDSFKRYANKELPIINDSALIAYIESHPFFIVISHSKNRGFFLLYPDVDLKDKPAVFSLPQVVLVVQSDRKDSLAIIGYHTLYETEPKAQGVTFTQCSESYFNIITCGFDSLEGKITKKHHLALNHLSAVIERHFSLQ